MAARVAESLRAGGCDPIVAIGGDAVALQKLCLATIADRWPGEGPLGGVVTALEHFTANVAVPPEMVVIAACDLPRITGATVTALLAALSSAPPTIGAAIAITDRPQPLCAAWRLTARQELSEAFANGERRILDVLATMQVVEVAVDSSFLVNVNTADDLPR